MSYELSCIYSDILFSFITTLHTFIYSKTEDEKMRKNNVTHKWFLFLCLCLVCDSNQNYRLFLDFTIYRYVTLNILAIELKLLEAILITAFTVLNKDWSISVWVAFVRSSASCQSYHSKGQKINQTGHGRNGGRLHVCTIPPLGVMVGSEDPLTTVSKHPPCD